MKSIEVKALPKHEAKEKNTKLEDMLVLKCRGSNSERAIWYLMNKMMRKHETNKSKISNRS